MPNVDLLSSSPTSRPPTATDLAHSIRNGEMSATKALEDTLKRIQLRNSQLNAVVTLNETGARRRAEEADEALRRGTVWGPLHGVPITVKDQFSTEGLRTTYGLPSHQNWVPEHDAVMVARLKRAGAIIVGKTNLPFAAYDWQCWHPFFGRTHNPWAQGYTPGGSSGGSAASLAAGFVPLELGADVGGSIRLPAHFCGVCGLRPSDGLLPTDGMMPSDRPMTVKNIVVPGPMARSVEDLQLGLHVLRTPIDTPLEPPHRPSSPDPASLNIAVTDMLGGVPADADTQRVLRNVEHRLTEAGANVRSVACPIDMDEALIVWGRIQGYELSRGLPWVFRDTPGRHIIWNGVIRFLFGFLASYLVAGAKLSKREYQEALQHRDDLRAELDSFLETVDAWITPTASIPSFPHCRTGRSLEIDGESVPYALPFAYHLPALAVTGHPIVTLPAGFTQKGNEPQRPIGVQVHGRYRHDDAVLATAHALETVIGTD
ncbi:amidase [Longibacter salinarum]|uniref:Amidase n=1 Tax=Longibacter salinarum TaxID=1850348 RepID=A0A2A8D0Y0_9BACT|nr:amidase [Longibacter salinarum]PEN14463.1 amidase [Longibacter salinarum]